jgi:hypothetical protein
MAADQERADRIRALKKEHPETTWDAIGDYVGVSTRAAQAWQETGGITYENAKKLAELWDEDLGYIMRGVRADTPDLIGSLNGDRPQLDRIEAKLDELLSLLRGESDGELAEFARALAEAEAQVAAESAGPAKPRAKRAAKRRAS